MVLVVVVGGFHALLEYVGSNMLQWVLTTLQQKRYIIVSKKMLPKVIGSILGNTKFTHVTKSFTI